MGLAGAAQVLRLERVVDELRRGQVIKHREEVVYALSSLWPHEASPEQLLDLARSHWAIENGQHYRRDRTQLEDRLGPFLVPLADDLPVCRSARAGHSPGLAAGL